MYFTDFYIKTSFSLEYRDGFERLLGFERSIVKERQREGIELAKKRGAFKGGVCRISDEKVSHMKHLLKEGVLLAKVSRIFGISRTSAYRYLECGKSKE